MVQNAEPMRASFKHSPLAHSEAPVQVAPKPPPEVEPGPQTRTLLPVPSATVVQVQPIGQGI